MIINADSILPYLAKRVRLSKSDASRHLLCTDCGIRTKLNRLGDGRRKCTICGKKFRINKITERAKLRQCSQILLCFCLDLPEDMTRQLGRYRSKTVAGYYKHFQLILTDVQKPTRKNRSFSAKKDRVSARSDPEVLARKIIDRMPADFLMRWF